MGKVLSAELGTHHGFVTWLLLDFDDDTLGDGRLRNFAASTYNSVYNVEAQPALERCGWNLRGVPFYQGTCPGSASPNPGTTRTLWAETHLISKYNACLAFHSQSVCRLPSPWPATRLCPSLAPGVPATHHRSPAPGAP